MKAQRISSSEMVNRFPLAKAPPRTQFEPTEEITPSRLRSQRQLCGQNDPTKKDVLLKSTNDIFEGGLIYPPMRVKKLSDPDFSTLPARASVDSMSPNNLSSSSLISNDTALVSQDSSLSNDSEIELFDRLRLRSSSSDLGAQVDAELFQLMTRMQSKGWTDDKALTRSAQPMSSSRDGIFSAVRPKPKVRGLSLDRSLPLGHVADS
jgi:hypothetical protein